VSDDKDNATDSPCGTATTEELMAALGPSKEMAHASELLNLRDWVGAALTAKGAKILGGGVGGGEADLEFELEGFRYSVYMRQHHDHPNPR